MSEAGLRVFNTNGGVQFSTDTTAYVYADSGTITTSHKDFPGITDFNGFPIKSAEYGGCWGTVSNEHYPESIIAVRSTANTPVLAFNSISRVLFSESNVITGYSRAPCTLTYYVFVPYKQMSSQGANNAALQVFRPNGQLAFDSRQQPLKIVSGHLSPSVAAGASTLFSGYDTSKTYAWMSTGAYKKTGYAAYTAPSPSGYNWNQPQNYAGIKRVSSSSFRIEPVCTSGSYGIGVSSSAAANSFAGGVLQCDVTGLSGQNPLVRRLTLPTSDVTITNRPSGNTNYTFSTAAQVTTAPETPVSYEWVQLQIGFNNDTVSSWSFVSGTSATTNVKITGNLASGASYARDLYCIVTYADGFEQVSKKVRYIYNT